MFLCLGFFLIFEVLLYLLAKKQPSERRLRQTAEKWKNSLTFGNIFDWNNFGNFKCSRKQLATLLSMPKHFKSPAVIILILLSHLFTVKRQHSYKKKIEQNKLASLKKKKKFLSSIEIPVPNLWLGKEMPNTIFHVTQNSKFVTWWYFNTSD